MQQDKKENIMGTMPVGKLLFTMSWPAILSMTINSLYNIVDSMFVSWVGEDALTAVTLAFPIQMLIISVSVGTGVGINSLIARRLGAGRFEEAQKAASCGFRLAFLNWIIFLVFGIFFAKPFMNAYADGESYIIEAGTSYLQITTILSIFLIIEVGIEKILQAQGNMKVPMLCSMVGAVVNIVMDPIMIFGLFGFPAMGVSGAAIATVLGQFVSMCMGLVFLFKGSHQVPVQIRGFKMDWRIVKEIYAVGFPSILMQSIGTVMNLALNAIIIDISKTGVAVLGVYFRLQSFVFMPTFGLNQGALPIFGYNYGARDGKRLMEAFKKAWISAFVIMFIGFALFQLFPNQLLGIFNASEEMLKIGRPALRLISICFLPASFGIMCSSMFQATGHGFWSLYASLIRQLVGIVPLAFFLSRIPELGVTGIWMAFPLAEVLGMIYSATLIRYLYKKELKYLNYAKQ